jgi:hypothetical protein
MAHGDHILTGEDILTARKFDIHDLNGKGTVLRSVPRRDTRDIPLRSLLPRLGVDDLLTAGCCISGGGAGRAEPPGRPSGREGHDGGTGHDPDRAGRGRCRARIEDSWSRSPGRPAGQPPSGRSERWSPGHLAVIP